MRNRSYTPFALALPVLLAACAGGGISETPVVSPGAMQDYLADKPEALRPLFAQVQAQGPRNAVLNNMRAGLAALDAGHVEVAQRAFEQAAERVELTHANNPAAERARSVWYSEREKEFKGEPHERVMLFYYLGLAQMMRGEYAQARVSFAQGLEQASFQQDVRTRAPATFATLSYLRGFAGACAAMPASEFSADFENAARENPALQPPPSGHNLLVLVETGTVPSKVHARDRRQFLAYAPPTRPALQGMTATLSNRSTLNLVVGNDLSQFVLSRGGRQVDAVNDGKANVQAGTQAAGNAALVGGAAALALAPSLGGQAGQNAAIAGAGLLLAGAIAHGIASAMHVDADIRMWDNLPGNILIGTGVIPTQTPARNTPRRARATTAEISAVIESSAGFQVRDPFAVVPIPENMRHLSRDAVRAAPVQPVSPRSQPMTNANVPSSAQPVTRASNLPLPPPPTPAAPPAVAGVAGDAGSVMVEGRAIPIRVNGPCGVAWGRQFPATNIPVQAPGTR